MFEKEYSDLMQNFNIIHESKWRNPIFDKEEKSSSPLEVILKRESLNISENKNVSVFKNPKPSCLAEYVGQENNKKSILTSLKIIKEIKPINIFIHGFPGCGKTLLSEIIAKELDANFIYSIPEQLKDVEKIGEIINKIQADEKLTVWMLDECHNIDKKLINILLPILQDQRLGDVQIRPFVMVMATTDYNKIYKKSEALLSRFQSKINLEKYSKEEIVTILNQYKGKMNVKSNIANNDLEIISSNCKGIPREAINMVLKRFVLENMEDVLLENNIVCDGINKTDVKILTILEESKAPMGLNFLAQKAGILEEDLKLIYEPYLIESGLIDRTNKGRMISLKGRTFLKTITEGN